MSTDLDWPMTLFSEERLLDQYQTIAGSLQRMEKLMEKLVNIQQQRLDCDLLKEGYSVAFEVSKTQILSVSEPLKFIV